MPAFECVVYDERILVLVFFTTPVKVHQHDSSPIRWFEDVVGAKIPENVAVFM